MHEMRTIAIDDPGRLSFTRFRCAKMAKRIEIPFRVKTPEGPSNTVQTVSRSLTAMGYRREIRCGLRRITFAICLTWSHEIIMKNGRRNADDPQVAEAGYADFMHSFPKFQDRFPSNRILWIAASCIVMHCVHARRLQRIMISTSSFCYAKTDSITQMRPGKWAVWRRWPKKSVKFRSAGEPQLRLAAESASNGVREWCQLTQL